MGAPRWPPADLATIERALADVAIDEQWPTHRLACARSIVTGAGSKLGCVVVPGRFRVTRFK